MSRRKFQFLRQWGHAVPLPFSKLLTRHEPIVALYHTVSNRHLPHVAPLYSYKTPSMFENDLLHLTEKYKVVSDREILAERFSNAKLPTGAAAITFDDGFIECHSEVQPLLMKHKAHAIFFIITNMMNNAALMHRNKAALCLHKLEQMSEQEAQSLIERSASRSNGAVNSRSSLRRRLEACTFQNCGEIDQWCDALEVDIRAFLQTQKPYMDEAQIRDLHNAGHTIGSHTCNHPELWLFRDWQKVEKEIVDSCAIIRDITGTKSVPVSIPFNGLQLDRNALADLRRKHDFIGLFYDTNNLMKDRDFMVNRIWCDDPTGASDVKANLPGQIRAAFAMEPLRKLKRKLLSAR